MRSLSTLQELFAVKWFCL